MEDWLGIYYICQETLVNRDPRETKMMLVFSLSAAYFRDSKAESDLTAAVPLFLIFATDMRFRGLEPPSTARYNLSDGTHPDHGRLVKLMSRFAHPLERTPAQTMKVRRLIGNSENGIKRNRRRKYNEFVNNLASTAAQSTIGRWPEK